MTSLSGVGNGMMKIPKREHTPEFRELVVKRVIVGQMVSAIGNRSTRVAFNPSSDWVPATNNEPRLKGGVHQQSETAHICGLFAGHHLATLTKGSFR